MGWPSMFVGAAFTGLLVLAYCTAKVVRAVHGLGRELERTRTRLAPRRSALQSELATMQDAQDAGDSRDSVRSS